MVATTKPPDWDEWWEAPTSRPPATSDTPPAADPPIDSSDTTVSPEVQASIDDLVETVRATLADAAGDGVPSDEGEDMTERQKQLLQKAGADDKAEAET